MLVPGGVTLPPREGEDAGKIQSIGARYAHGELTPRGGRRAGLPGLRQPGRRLPVPGHGGHVAGRGRGAGHDAAPRGAGPFGPADLARHGPAVGPRPGRAGREGIDDCATILTDAAIRNAMVVHAAFGGSTNLLLHIPAIAFAAGLRRPTVDDWHEVNLKVPRLVSVLPNGPFYHPTVRAFLAGGVPEVMLHLRALGLLDESVAHRDGRAAGARARLVGGERAAQAAPRAAVRAGRRRSRRRDHEPEPGQGARADQHRHVPARQPRARGLGDQEHGDRPERRRRRRRLSQDRPGAGLHPRAARRSPRSRGRASSRSSPATSWS